MYNPANWYWIVGSDPSQVYSSAAAAYVPNADAAYVAWRSAGNAPTRIDTEESLNDVLLAAYPAGALHGAPTMSPLIFMARFTDAETMAIHTAAMSNVALFGWLLQCAAASYVDLTDPRTKAGLDALVAAGLLTADRETSILTP